MRHRRHRPRPSRALARRGVAPRGGHRYDYRRLRRPGLWGQCRIFRAE